MNGGDPGRTISRNQILAYGTSTVVSLWLVGLLFPTPVGGLGSAPGDIAAKIIHLSGEVEIFVVQRSESGRSLGRKWIPAKAGDALHLKDHIRTRQGRARIEFTDGDEAKGFDPTTTHILENTEARLWDFSINYENRSHSFLVIDLLRGAIRNFLQGWGENSGFSVRAGVAVCSLRGIGEFEIHYDPSQEMVKVTAHKGQVVLTGPGGSRLMKAGEGVLMIGGAFPENPPT